MSRTVTLVLVDRAGTVLGALPPFDVELPWWPEVRDVVTGARQRYGVDVSVLRILSTQLPRQPGGAVTYLAEVAHRPAAPLPAAAVDQAPHPLRAPYAEVGGPAASLAWAAATLRRLGRGGPVATHQYRTWNLSTIWRLDCADGPVWLKQVPPFLAREPIMLAWLNERAPGLAPELIAADGQGRSLLGHAPGEDRFGAPLAERQVMARLLHTVQLPAAGAVDELTARGIPRPGDAETVELVRSVARRYGAGIAGLPRLVDELPDRLAAIRACGLPDTLVHGDFHPGNVRADGAGAPVIIDWGEATVGNPGADILALAGGLPPADAAALRDEWAARWVEAFPGCDPLAALALLRPVQELRGAVLYAGFLAHIEPSEHRYHADDVPDCLRAAVAAA